MGGCLCKAHQHPEPPDLAPVGNKGQVIKRGTLKWDILEASLQVQHVDLLSPPELRLVLSCAIELVLVLGHPFIN